MSVLPNIKLHATTAAQELASNPRPADFPGLRQLADFMSHSVADIETYAYIREFWKGIDQTLFGLTTDPNLFYSRIFQERENVTELAEMIPIWWEKRRILAQSTIIDCAKKIQRAQKLCEAIMKQEIVAEPAA